MSWTRRAALVGLGAGLAVPALAEGELGPEAEFGWAIADASGRAGLSIHANQRFPMCSTFKWLLAARVLSRVDAGSEHLGRAVTFGAADIEDYAPKTKIALSKGGGVHGRMTVDALCEAAVTLSDNTAANLLLAETGGPAALTAWLRAHGDTVTRLDRVEPALNRVAFGDLRDTTSPAAIVGDLRRILFGDVLTRASRARLLRWLLDCKTGETRLKAGLPAGWRIAQKTGTWTYHHGERAASGDVGVLFPPSGEPILIAAYTAGSTRPQAEVDAWFASVGRAVAAARA